MKQKQYLSQLLRFIGFVVTFIIFNIHLSLAHSAHHEDHTQKDSKEGFGMSSVAYSTFGIQTIKPHLKFPLELPKSALLLSQDDTSIYIVRKSRFFRVPVRLKKKSSEKVWIDTNDLQSDDQIVIQGVGFLRIAELGSNGQEAEGHRH